MAWTAVITDIVTQPDLDVQLSNYYLASEVDSDLATKLDQADGTASNLKLTSIGADPTSAISKANLDGEVSTINTALSGKASLTGATFTGSVVVPAATVDGNPVRLDQLGNYLPIAGGTVTGPIIYSSAPGSGTHLTNKTYVDGVAALKADITYVDTELADKADTTLLDDYAALAGAAFTGIVTTPEPDQSEDSQTVATTAFVNLRVSTDIAQKADISNPTINDVVLTGSTTAPTAIPGDSTTAIATTAFTTGAINALKVSPAFSGIPTSPLPALGDDSNQIATTAWVRDLLLDEGLI